MAVELLSSSDDFFPNAVATNNEDYTYDSLTSGANRALIVFPVYEKTPSDNDVTAVAYSGDNGTQDAENRATTDNFAEYGEIWTIVDPATGENTLEHDLLTPGQDFGSYAVVFTGVGDFGTTPIAVSKAGSGEELSHTITISAGSAVVFCCVRNRSAGLAGSSPVSGCTTIRTDETSTGSAGFSVLLGYRPPEASAGTYAIGCTDTTTQSGLVLAIELKEAAGGAVIDASVIEALLASAALQSNGALSASQAASLSGAVTQACAAELSAAISDGGQVGASASSSAVYGAQIAVSIAASHAQTTGATIDVGQTETLAAGSSANVTAAFSAVFVANGVASDQRAAKAIQEAAQADSGAAGNSQTTGNIIDVTIAESIAASASLGANADLTGVAIHGAEVGHNQSASALLSAQAQESSAAGAQQSLGKLIESVVVEALSVGGAQAVSILIDGSVTEALVGTGTASASAALNASAQVNAAIIDSVISQALLNAGIAEATVISATQDGSKLLLAIPLPEGRTTYVKVESRITIVAAENRTTTIQ